MIGVLVMEGDDEYTGVPVTTGNARETTGTPKMTNDHGVKHTAPAFHSSPSDNHDNSGQPAGGASDEFFAVISSILSCMESAVEVLRATGEEDKQMTISDKAQWKRPQLSTVSKRRLMNRTISNLAKGIEELSMLKKAGEDLQQHYLSSQLQHSAAERSRQEIYMQLHHISGNMHDTGVKLNKAEAARIAASKERDAMQTKMDELHSQVDQLQRTLNERDQEISEAKSRLQAQESTVEEAKRQCQNAIEEASAAVGGAQTAETRAAECQAALEKCKLASQRNQEAVGRITADNLMLVMRLKKAEKEVAELSKERDLLKAGVEKQEGPWFDTVRAGVEQQVNYAMARATELEAILERTRQSHSEQLKQERAAFQIVEGELEASTKLSCRLQQDLEECKEELAGLKQAFADAGDEIKSLKDAVESSRAEVRVLNETVKDMRHECQEAAMRVSAATAAESAANTTLDNARAEREELKNRAERLQSALDAQTEVNKQLMSRKSDIEWQLMTALASAPQSSVAEVQATASQGMATISRDPNDRAVSPSNVLGNCVIDRTEAL